MTYSGGVAPQGNSLTSSQVQSFVPKSNKLGT